MRGQMTKMLIITFMSGPHDGKALSWPYPDEGKSLNITIGRREGCDIFLGYDSQVSRLHACIVYDTNAHILFLEDTGSRNGTFLDGMRVDGREPIRPGTLFRIGRPWFQV